MSISNAINMEYRLLENTEIKLSILGLNNIFEENINEESIKDLIQKSLNKGINYFYINNDSKHILEIFTKIIEDLKISRDKIFIIYNLSTNDINDNIKFSLFLKNTFKNLHLDYIDLILYPNYNISIDAICKNMNILIQEGLTKFWGTSEWSYKQIEETIKLCEQINLIPPIIGLFQYNIFNFETLNSHFSELIKNNKYGIMVYSSYSSSISNELSDNNLKESILDINFNKNNDKIEKLKLYAKNNFNCNINQLINAYIIKNENINTCLLNNSNIDDFENNIKVLEIYKKLDDKNIIEIENILSDEHKLEHDKNKKDKKDTNNYNISKFNFSKKFLIILILLAIHFNNYPYIYNIFKPQKMMIYSYIRRRYKKILDSLPYYNHTHITNNTIYWCWLQGIEKAPELYLSTLNSVMKNLKDFNLVIITEENMLNYISFPDYILDKYKRKIISPTHFSDLIRLELLISYGGTWIDASVLITGYTEMFYNNDLFFFQERNPGCVGSNWFITAEKGSPILRSTQYLLYEYWKYRDDLYDYYIFHLMLALSSERYKKDLKKIPYLSNRPPHRLRNTMFGIYSKEYYDKLLNDSSVHKLTVKWVPDGPVGFDTYYNHIIEEYYPKEIIS